MSQLKMGAEGELTGIFNMEDARACVTVVGCFSPGGGGAYGKEKTGCLSKSTGNESTIEARASTGFWSESVYLRELGMERELPLNSEVGCVIICVGLRKM